MNKKRSRARGLAVQGLYQWQVAGQDIGAILTQFLTDPESGSFDHAYFSDLLKGVPTRLTELDQMLEPYLDRAIGRVDPVERAILRLGAYELTAHPETPYRVVINEMVELAKTYGAEKGHRYVNGVLDKLARERRAVAVRARGT